MKSPIVSANTQNWEEQDYRKMGMWENWLVLRDISNSIQYGFSQYRLPKPGQTIDVDKAHSRTEKIEREWQKETIGRVDFLGQKPPKFNSLPVEAKCYLHSVLTSSPEDIRDYYAI